MGLSPRARGNPSMGKQMNARFGSIPACAGEPCTDLSGHGFPNGSIPACAGEPDGHIIGQCPRMTTGLSPRARGNLFPA